MTRRDAWQWIRRNWFEVVVVVAVPILVWGAKRYDATKVDRSEFVRYQLEQAAQYRLDEAHHESDDRQLRYLVCRQDFTRRECLDPNRP